MYTKFRGQHYDNHIILKQTIEKIVFLLKAGKCIYVVSILGFIHFIYTICDFLEGCYYFIVA